MTSTVDPVRLVLLGGGGTAADVVDIVADINQCGTRYACTAMLDDNPALWRTHCHGIPVVGSIAMAKEMPGVMFVNTLGSPHNPAARKMIDRMLGIAPDRFASIVHPSVFVAGSARLGPGCIIYPNVTLMARARLGRQVLILANSIVNHDVVLGDYATLASGVNLAGGASIGECAYIGAGSCIRGDVEVASEALVGMGSVVIRDVASGVCVAGNPARLLHRAEKQRS